jgi:glycerol kinase
MKKYILAIDQGTTGSTAMIVDNSGQIIGSADKDFPQIFPKPGWVEHNPEDIWNSVVETIERVIALSKIQPSAISAIGITNQRETIVAWDRMDGKAVYNAIVWQCRRTTAQCELIKKQNLEKTIRKKTGLVVDPYFSATKISWILKNVPKAKELLKQNRLCVGTIDSYLLWKLTGGNDHKTEVSNASRTMLMNLKTLDWDPDLLKLFSVPKKVLPKIESSAGVFGLTQGLKVLPNGIPISGMLGDQQAALFGQTCFKPGNVKCTFGTGSFILQNTGEKIVYSKHRMLTTVAWKINGKVNYALEGGAFVCGAAVHWLRDGLNIIENADEVEKLANNVDSSDCVYFVPALTGLGAPYWAPSARGAFFGLSRGTTRSHIARATLESMALQNVDILSAMAKDYGKKINILGVDGGATSNNLLMQIQADYLGVTVRRPKIIETTALGAALIAGLGIGLWKSLKELTELHHIDQEFTPRVANKDRLQLIAKWHKVVKQTIF